MLSLQSSVVQAAKFLVVPFRSLRVGSSIVSVRVGTTSFNKRLMSNATAKSVPLSINNNKGKAIKGSDNDFETMTFQELRASLRQVHAPYFVFFVWYFVSGFIWTAIHQMKVLVQRKWRLLHPPIQYVSLSKEKPETRKSPIRVTLKLMERRKLNSPVRRS
ncbi:hypothetical protein HA466_0203410 [Hirschfeldia incana]|nr:hypothetical protein HA466_0203410 [Hirschfeldia incana]